MYKQPHLLHPASPILHHPPLLSPPLCSLLLQGLANVLGNWRHPQTEGLSCVYWSCWKWLKRDLRWEVWDCYHCVWFITLRPRGGGPVAAVTEPHILGAPSTQRASENEAYSAPALPATTSIQTHTQHLTIFHLLSFLGPHSWPYKHNAHPLSLSWAIVCVQTFTCSIRS